MPKASGAGEWGTFGPGPAFRQHDWIFQTGLPRAAGVTRVGGRYSCSEMLLRLDEYVDRSLSPFELRLVEAHLDDCLHCAGQFRFEVDLVRSIRERLRRIEVPAHLVQRVLLRLEAEAAGS